MNSANSVAYYHGNGDFCNIMVQRYKDNGNKNLECEYCPLTKAEAGLVTGWAEQVLDSKQFRFTTMELRGWTIFLPKQVVNAKPLDKRSILDKLVEAISRHPSAEADADVADAINAIDDELRMPNWAAS